MPLSNRLENFRTQVVTKNLPQAKRLTYARQYHRLVLTRRIAETAIIMCLVFGGQQFLLQNNFFSPIWPASGVALSAVFLRGNFLLVGVFLGTLASYLLNHFGWKLSLLETVMFTGYIFGLRYLALRWIGAITPLRKSTTLWQFILLLSLFSALHTALILEGLSHWYAGWLGEINGILCLTPLCLIFDPFVPARFFHPKLQGWWPIGLFIILSQGLYFIVAPGFASHLVSLFFMVILGCYAYYYGQVPTGFTLLGMAVIYFSGVIFPHHLFHNSTTVAQDLTQLTLFTLMILLSLGIAPLRRASLH